jgi:hypothetical protein
MEHAIPLRAYSYKELTALYGVSQRTLKTWLAPFTAEIGEKHSRYFTVRQVRIIFNRLGLPGAISDD